MRVSPVAARSTSCTILLSTWAGPMCARSSQSDERICADAHLVYVLADCATLVSNVFSDVIFRTHRGAYDAEAIDLDYA